MAKNDIRKFVGELKDRAAEKDFNAALLDAENNEEGEGLRKISFEIPKWHKLLNPDGTCYLYVHSVTRDVTAIRPENYEDPTPTEVAKERERGIPMRMLEAEIERVKNYVFSDSKLERIF